VPTEQLCGVKIDGSAGGDVGNGGSNQAPERPALGRYAVKPSTSSLSSNMPRSVGTS
jgi:hypothetical protein